MCRSLQAEYDTQYKSCEQSRLENAGCTETKAALERLQKYFLFCLLFFPLFFTLLIRDAQKQAYALGTEQVNCTIRFELAEERRLFCDSKLRSLFLC